MMSDPNELGPNEIWPCDLGPDKPGPGTSGPGVPALPHERWIRPSRRAHLALSAALVLTGSVLTVTGLASSGGPSRPAAQIAVPAGSAAGSPQMVPVAADVSAGLPYAEPTTLTIPTIGVHAPIVDTGQAADGTPQVPPFAHPEQVGWYTSTASPGERGSSVLWGHLDTKTGTAVFQNLSALTVGDTVQVTRADGRVATFTVERTAVYPNDEVPVDTLYDDPGYPALRLVTCGGQFDRQTQEYASNVVVFTRLTSATAALTAVKHPAPIDIPAPRQTPAHRAAHPKAKPPQASSRTPAPTPTPGQQPKPLVPGPPKPLVPGPPKPLPPPELPKGAR
jgi:LPXTG-site transpeptidase (sortase) family protein